MGSLSEEDIKLIHAKLEKKFPLMLKGIDKEGLISAAIQRQTRQLYGSEEQYQGVFKKTAVLMEAITRWHIFYDGNKRTGLLCAFLYLYANKHYLAIPIDAVRFTQKIAATEGTEQEQIDDLIEEIETWLEKYTTKDPFVFTFKVLKYSLFPALKLSILHFIGFRKYVEKRLDYLFATKAHPEYKQESTQVPTFLIDLMQEAVIKSLEIKKNHPRDLELPTLDAMGCAMSGHEVLLSEEDKLFEEEPDENGIRRHDSTCFHCRKKVHLKTDPDDEDGYLIFEYEEQESEN